MAQIRVLDRRGGRIRGRISGLPVYFRLMFGGELTYAFAERVVDALLHGYAARPAHPHAVD